MEKLSNKIILASSSARRKFLMEEEGYNFEVIASNAAEATQEDIPNPIDLVQENAILKADFIAKNFENRVVIGSDTTVALGSQIFGKPRDLNHAKEMLRFLQGKTHSVFTAIAIIKKDENICDVSFDESKVTFKEMSEEDIENYLQKVDVLDKAGAYAAQEFGELIIEKIDGNFDNVMGLPMSLLKKRLDSLFKDAYIFKVNNG